MKLAEVASQLKEEMTLVSSHPGSHNSNDDAVDK